MSKGLIEMSKDLYKFGGKTQQLRCQGFESFLHTLIVYSQLLDLNVTAKMFTGRQSCGSASIYVCHYLIRFYYVQVSQSLLKLLLLENVVSVDLMQSGKLLAVEMSF